MMEGKRIFFAARARRKVRAAQENRAGDLARFRTFREGHRDAPFHETHFTGLDLPFDPETVRQMKASATRDISVGGPGLAAEAIESGLVDEYHLFQTPILVGGGTSSFPNDVRLELELLDERRFANGAVHLHYRAKARSA
jgi:riboflavin biosynthesis pyrimidine reductase